MITYTSTTARWVAIVITVFVMTGCAQFEHPLSPIEEAKVDPDLLGTWVVQYKDENGVDLEAYIHIGEAGALDPDDNDRNIRIENWRDRHAPFPYKGLTRIVCVSYEAEGKLKSESWLAFPTKIGKQRFASVPMSQDGEVVSYYFWRYEVSNDQLKIWTDTVDEKVDSLLEKQRLTRTDSLITNDTASLRNLLEENGGDILFAEAPSNTLKRLKKSN
ncbi:hypothetical protein [Bremerella cremea]|uniref:hypothetical protein n=1 Tax=Bremerella cremea TaxID=1031537 RepID=UPI0031E64B74